MVLFPEARARLKDDARVVVYGTFWIAYTFPGRKGRRHGNVAQHERRDGAASCFWTWPPRCQRQP